MGNKQKQYQKRVKNKQKWYEKVQNKRNQDKGIHKTIVQANKQVKKRKGKDTWVDPTRHKQKRCKKTWKKTKHKKKTEISSKFKHM